MYKKIVALSTSALMALTLAAGCGSGTTTGTDNPQPQPAQSYCSIFATDCGPQASAPNGGGDSSPKASKQPLPQDTYAFRWGDYKFGSCTLSLFPGYLGLTVSNAHVVILAGVGCVGFRPQVVNITMELQRWYSVAGEPRNWHGAGKVIIYDSSIDGGPNLVIPAPDGSVPLSELTQLKDAMPCVRDIQQGLSLYRLHITITGVSYGGSPINLGGDGSALAVHNIECNN